MHPVSIYEGRGHIIGSTLEDADDIRDMNNGKVKCLDYFNEGESETQAKFAALRDRWLSPFISVLARTGVSPSVVSAVGVACCLGAVFLAPQAWIFVAILLGLYVFADGVDGPLARATGAQSQGGSLVDIFSDQVGVMIVAVGASYWLGANPALTIGFGFLYIHVVYMMVICNLIGAGLPKIMRVKYVFFALYVVALYLQSALAINLFCAVFGAYYGYFFVLLFQRIFRALK